MRWMLIGGKKPDGLQLWSREEFRIKDAQSDLIETAKRKHGKAAA
jgi:hypothetical protein